VSCGLIGMIEEVEDLGGRVSGRLSENAFVPGVSEECAAGVVCEKGAIRG